MASLSDWWQKGKQETTGTAQAVLVDDRNNPPRRWAAIVVGLVAALFLTWNYAKRYGWLPGAKPEPPKTFQSATPRALSEPGSEGEVQETVLKKPQTADPVAIDAQGLPTVVAAGPTAQEGHEKPAVDTQPVATISAPTPAPALHVVEAPAQEVRVVDPLHKVAAAPKSVAAVVEAAPAASPTPAIQAVEAPKAKSKPIVHRVRVPESESWGDGTRIF